MHVEFEHFDPVQSLYDLIDIHFENNYFVKNAVKTVNKEHNRIWSTPETGNWWNTMEVTIISTWSL